MMKNIVRYIFIYIIGILFVGCEPNYTFGPVDSVTEECSYCYLELEAPDLPMDENGVYHLDYRNGDLQSFTSTLSLFNSPNANSFTNCSCSESRTVVINFVI